MMVVNLPIVAQPQERKLLDAERLHSIEWVHNCQPMKPKAAVCVAVYILKTKSIRTSMGNLHGIGALN